VKAKREGGIKPSEFLIALMVATIVVILALIKIYISNRIYYESREFRKIYHELSALKEENRILKMNVEKLKYKSEVEDTVMSYDELFRSESDKKSDENGAEN